MPWKVKSRGEYPPDWTSIAHRTKAIAHWKCIRCGVHNGSVPNVLTTHHFDGDKSNCVWWNLLSLCQRCHLSIQARVNPEQVYAFEHADWLKPYVAGFYAKKYLDENLTRKEVVARLDELLALERLV